ncbi:hypothetical protein [Bacteroides cellulosilyticus]|nr:hypothetical protein [Bacteroides cellulosilyticus]
MDKHSNALNPESGGLTLQKMLAIPRSVYNANHNSGLLANSL